MPNPLKDTRHAYQDLWLSMRERDPNAAEDHARQYPEAPMKYWRDEARRREPDYDPFG